MIQGNGQFCRKKSRENEVSQGFDGFDVKLKISQSLDFAGKNLENLGKLKGVIRYFAGNQPISGFWFSNVMHDFAENPFLMPKSTRIQTPLTIL